MPTRADGTGDGKCRAMGTEPRPRPEKHPETRPNETGPDENDPPPNRAPHPDNLTAPLNAPVKTQDAQPAAPATATAPREKQRTLRSGRKAPPPQNNPPTR